MENNRKIVNYILFFLIFILISILILINWLTKKPSLNKKNVGTSSPTITINQSNSSLKVKSVEKNSLTPTVVVPTIEVRFTGVKEVEIPKEIINQTSQELELKKKSPYLIDDFFIEYDYRNDYFVFYPKDKNVPLSEENINQIKEKIKNTFPQIPEGRFHYSQNPPPPLPKKEEEINPTIIIPLSSPSQTELPNSFNSLLGILRIFYGMGNITSDSLNNSSENLSSSNISPFLSPSLLQNNQPTVTVVNPIRYKNFVYFSQCDSRYGNYLMPGGCTICYAACGPTTVAMIVSSYKNQVFPPIDSVNQYGTRVGCNGSSYLDAMSILSQNGIKVGKVFLATGYYEGKKADEVADEFRKYILAGKTIFALANFKSDGGGHYFWIVDVDNQGNIWALDSAYGRNQIPYNENSRYPYPLYRVAFPVSP